MDSNDEQEGKAKRKNIQSPQTWPYRRHKSFEKELREAAAEWFSRKGLDTYPRRNYSLKSHDDWQKNIISEEVIDYIEQENERHLGQSSFPLHNFLSLKGRMLWTMIFNKKSALHVVISLLSRRRPKACYVRDNR